MADLNIHASHALLKELKSQTYHLLVLTDEIDILGYRLRQLHKAFTKVCEAIDYREA